MANKNGQQNIAELEYFFGKYFDAHIAPIADKAVKNADASFLKEYDKMIMKTLMILKILKTLKTHQIS